jgi:hypothetical protein
MTLYRRRPQLNKKKHTKKSHVGLLMPSLCPSSSVPRVFVALEHEEKTKFKTLSTSLNPIFLYLLG